ncbi:aminoglycoside phosphotransferase (APT) family kinase protein [Friedmanniella endophytica]|uniref:Aminoglycoside phosphotransferase (APT) family kinase protein n=1 Tax=Microlunatus kandeliicorticis TaxID=1759536 RepID=A0A7W3IPQ3_9ACTN|nr:aminoglycoside phosphotransferase family protein [Microlunatus kandeliicorticis]MBA8792954.1 aminoglycoside phosphotransferase (APT) family kinase protein [Microlunatus kandeliicorticis]
MRPADLARATGAALAVARSVGLSADDAVVLHDSNKVALRLTPCEVLARVGEAAGHGTALELDRALALRDAGCPVGDVLPDLDPVVRTHDGFAVTLWVYYPPAAPELTPSAYADALARLHAGMRTLALPVPRWTDRVGEALTVIESPAESPALTDDDRTFLAGRMARLRAAVEQRGAPEQLLHGEPHRGNVLRTADGPRFIDFETLCVGPVAFDLAHVPDAACAHYPGLDPSLLAHCRQLVLAVVAAWRWQRGDAFPDRERWAHTFVRTLRQGPPWPSLDALTRSLARD